MSESKTVIGILLTYLISLTGMIFLQSYITLLIMNRLSKKYVGDKLFNTDTAKSTFMSITDITLIYLVILLIPRTLNYASYFGNINAPK